MSQTTNLICNYGEDVKIECYVQGSPLPTYAQVSTWTLDCSLYADAGYANKLVSATVTVLSSPPAIAPANSPYVWIESLFASAKTQQLTGAAQGGTFYWRLARLDTGAHTDLADGKLTIRPVPAI